MWATKGGSPDIDVGIRARRWISATAATRFPAIAAGACVAMGGGMRHAAILGLLFASSASAQPGLAPVSPPAEEVTSYRTWTLASDAASLGLMLGSFAAEGPNGRDTSTSSTLLAVGLGGAFLGAPIIHAARGHWARAGGSLAMRWALAGAGMMIGVASQHCDSGDAFCKLDGIGPGILGGLVVASLIDAVALTDERRAPAPSWTPQVAAGRSGVSLGFAAHF
jgi:hypothetical protein